MKATLALLRWGHLFENRKVILYTDNQCAASILNKCSCKNVVLMQYMRDMFWQATKYNFVLKVIYMPGYLQYIPDAISRLNEHNGLMSAQTHINNWYMCHVHCYNGFSYFSLLNHMSMKSLLHIFEQVITWRRASVCWTKTWRNIIVKRHMLIIQKLHIGVNWKDF